MRRFSALYAALDSTNSTSRRVALLSEYLSSVPPADAAWALWYLSGNRLPSPLPTKVLRRFACVHTGTPEWMLARCHEAVGDLSETVALLLGPGDPETSCEEGLAEFVTGRVLPLASASESASFSLVRETWDLLDAQQRLVYHKLMRGGFRVGVQKRTVTRAMAEAFGVSIEEMALRLSGTIEPTARWFTDATAPAESSSVSSRPYPFFLAHQIPAEHADDLGTHLGPIEAWQIEHKWDGIRAQLLRRSHLGLVSTLIWSRGEELITDQFPELVRAAGSIPPGTVLDGEVVAWDREQGTPRPFADLQRRLGRKPAERDQPTLFASDDDPAGVPVVFLAYDLLELDNTDLRAMRLAERRSRLESLLSSEAPSGLILVSERVKPGSWEDARNIHASSRERNTEGLMLKRVDAPYGIGRTIRAVQEGAAWLKWKVDPLTIDAVLTAAQPGSGRRAGMLTDYTFSLWDDRVRPLELVVFAKAYSGLDRVEIESLDKWVRAHTTLRRGPVRVVEPTRVFEIAFEGVRRSDRHKSGYAVRFPRILRERTDKPASLANTLGDLVGLLNTGL